MAIRVEYIEDGDFRDSYTFALKQGLSREDVTVEARENFNQLREDLASGNLADVYILDNEIAGDHEVGAKMALEITRRAKEAGRQVIVITLLCSAPDAVRREFGERLDEKDIPICSKFTDAALVGFYVGRCIKEGVVGFQQWLTSEGISLPGNSDATRDVQSKLLAQLEVAEEGGFYLSPRDFIERNREGVTEHMKEEGVRELDRVFPVGSGTEIKQ